MMKKWNKERRVMLPSFLISKSKSFLTFVVHAPPYGFWALMSKGLKV